MPHGSANAKMLIRAGSAAGVPRVPREPALSAQSDGVCSWRRASRVPRSDVAAFSQLHYLSSEDSRQPRGQEPAAMRRLLITIAALRPAGGAATGNSGCNASRTSGCNTAARAAPKAAPTADPSSAAPKPPAASATASPVPADDNWLTGYIDLGYRWLTGVGGSFDTYRSIVNLGSGPKLLGTDFTIRDSRHRLFRPHRRFGRTIGEATHIPPSMWTRRKRSSTTFRPTIGTSPTTTICPRSRTRCWPQRG